LTPEVAKCCDLVFIKGPGLDYVIEDTNINRIVLLDPYFGDVYGDYIFAGYDVVSEVPKAVLADVAGFHTSAVLLSKKPAIVVCGFEPQRCLVSLASYLIKEEGLKTDEAVEKAKSVLSKIYDKPLVMPEPAKLGLDAYLRLRNLFGHYLDSFMALGFNYEFGKDPLHWSEGVSWANALGYDDVNFLAYALHFLAEGHGTREEVFKRRMEAVGEEPLREMLGEEGLVALKVLEEFVRGRAKEIEFVEAMKPGEGYVRAVRRDGNKALIKCVGCQIVEELRKLLPLERVGIEEVSTERVSI